MITTGKNIAMRVDGNKLVVEIDLTQECGKSKSGKSILVASTGGNLPLPEAFSHMKMGLNIYK